MLELDLTRRYLTRSGHSVTFHEPVLKNSCGELVTFPLKGSVQNHRGEGHYQIWTLDGRADLKGPHRDDIMSKGDNMGLDMYLTAVRSFWGSEEKPTIDGHEIETAETEVGHWIKADQIHHWFVENVQGGKDNCKTYDVGRAELQELQQECLRAIETKDQRLFSFAKQSKSPAAEQQYWDDLRDTLEITRKCLTDFSQHWDFVYRASW
jgi:hypothetical protein